MSTRRLFDTDDPAINPYRLLTALVVPRPIAWVSTISGDGRANLAPHSFFTVASARPPVVQFTSVGAKDTLRNVLETGEFVVNLASRPQLEQINQTSAPYPHGVDEAGAAGVATEPSDWVRPYRVTQSPASIECVLHTTLEVGDSTIVLGTVVAITVREEMLIDDRPAFDRLQALSRLGGSEWGLPPEVFRLARPTKPRE